MLFIRKYESLFEFFKTLFNWTTCRLKAIGNGPAVGADKFSGISVVFSLFLVLVLFPQISGAQTSPEIAEVQARIEKIRQDLSFEKKWGKLLSEGGEILKSLQDVNSAFGVLLRNAANLVSVGATEQKIAGEIAKANRLLEPFFRLDQQGNLQWGSALQMIGIQAQFIPQGMTALTPEAAASVLNEWQQGNLAQIEVKSQELEKLNSDLERLQKAESAATESEREKNAGLIAALAAQLEEDLQTLRALKKLQKEFFDADLEMKIHLATVAKAENTAQKARDLWSGLFIGLGTLGEYLEGAGEQKWILEDQVARLNQATAAYALYSKVESKAADQICGYADRLSSEPSPSATEVERWKAASATVIATTESSLEGAEPEAESIMKLVNSMNAAISSLRGNLAGLESFQRDTFLEVLGQLRKVKNDGNLENAEKTLPRIKELKNILKRDLLFSNDIGAKLYDSVWTTKGKAETLAKNGFGADKKLEEELSQLQARIETAYNQAQKITETTEQMNAAEIPEVPALSSVFLNIQKILKAESFEDKEINKIFQRLDSALSEGKEAIAQANVAIARGALSPPGGMQRAKNCFATLQKVPEKGKSDPEEEKTEPGVAAVAAMLQQILDARQQAVSLFNTQQRLDNDLKAALRDCAEADAIRGEMLSGLALIEKREKNVFESVSGATDIANKCPAVNNPQNITTLYERGGWFLRQIIENLAWLKNANAVLREKRSLAEKKRTDALGEMSAVNDALGVQFSQVDALWASITGRTSINEIGTMPPQMSRLWEQAIGAVEEVRSIKQQAQTLKDRAAASPPCSVPPGDDLVAQAETAYTGALINFGAGETLPARAAACLAKEPTDKKEPTGDELFDENFASFLNKRATGEENRSQKNADQNAGENASPLGNRNSSDELDRNLDELQGELLASRGESPDSAPLGKNQQPSQSTSSPQTLAPSEPPAAANDPAQETNQNQTPNSAQNSADSPPPTQPEKGSTKPTAPPEAKAAPSAPAPVAPPIGPPKTPIASPSNDVNIYLGAWNISGKRRDGITRTGRIVINRAFLHTYRLIDEIGNNQQSKTEGAGSWTVEQRLGKIYLILRSVNGKTWEGFTSGSLERFTFPTKEHGTYTFTRIP